MRHDGGVTDTAPPDPLTAEAARKAAIAWLTVADRPPAAVWCLPRDGLLYVVAGPGEQSVPGLAELPPGSTVGLTLRGDHGGRIVHAPARADRIPPDDPDWAELAGALAAKRLNTPGPAAAQRDRWARECAVVRLTPLG